MEEKKDNSTKKMNFKIQIAGKEVPMQYIAAGLVILVILIGYAILQQPSDGKSGTQSLRDLLLSVAGGTSNIKSQEDVSDAVVGISSDLEKSRSDLTSADEKLD